MTPKWQQSVEAAAASKEFINNLLSNKKSRLKKLTRIDMEEQLPKYL